MCVAFKIFKFKGFKDYTGISKISNIWSSKKIIEFVPHQVKITEYIRALYQLHRTEANPPWDEPPPIDSTLCEGSATPPPCRLHTATPPLHPLAAEFQPCTPSREPPPHSPSP